MFLEASDQVVAVVFADGTLDVEVFLVFIGDDAFLVLLVPTPECDDLVGFETLRTETALEVHELDGLGAHFDVGLLQTYRQFGFVCCLLLVVDDRADLVLETLEQQFLDAIEVEFLVLASDFEYEHPVDCLIVLLE